MRLFRRDAVLAASLILLTPHPPDPPARGNPGPAICEPADSARGPSRDLYCIALVPIPELSGPGGAGGMVELGQVATPFGAAVTRDGRQQYALAITLRGLPDPATLGPYTRYVAWAATPTLSSVTKLGPVDNGRTTLGVLAMNKFLILVSAEPSADIRERTGRLVLRGRSPSLRLGPHAVFALPSTRPGRGTGHDHSHGSPEWPMPPMDPGFTMVQSLEGLEPGATPFLPPADSTAPVARPREVVRLADGDTLELVAEPVRRALKGRTYVMYGFNGQYPGPLIQVEQNATIVVDFANHLQWPTAVHWHGIRLDNRFDGVPGVTQPAVPPGGRFRYRVHFPDAGIYWYHPHHREDVLQDLGLYGNILVQSPDSGYFNPANREQALILDDILVADSGLVPYGLETATHALMGRFGNLLLVNGEPRYDLAVSRGAVVRFFLTNVSSTRTFNLSFGGAAIKLVGSDVGKFEREAWVSSVVLAPAERYIVEVRFPTAGTVALTNQVQALDHVTGFFVPQVDTLGLIHVAHRPAVPDHGASFATLREHREVQDDIDRYQAEFDRPVDHELVLTLRTGDLPFPLVQLLRLDSAYANPVEWSGTMPMMDWLSTGHQVEWVLRDPATGKENRDIDWHFTVGDVIKLRITNDRHSLHAMQHPIHLHGQRFLILRRNGVPTSNLVWKDTALLPAGSTMELLVEMSNPGRWMLHCHIAEHLEAGMQMVFTVAGGAGGAD